MRKLVCLVLVAGAFACSTSEASNSDAPEVVFETTLGSFTLQLDAKKAPITAKNILSYVDSGFYEGILFHRVIPGFMIQVGGFVSGLQRKQPNAPIKNEATNGLKNLRGTVSMARTSNPDSATSQFFINLVANVSLDHRDTTPRGMGYAVFGKISEGMDVVDAIAKVKTQCPSKTRQPCTAKLPPGMRDVPETEVVIKKAYRKK